MTDEVEAILRSQRASIARYQRMVAWLCRALGAVAEESQCEHCPPRSQVSLLCSEDEEGCARCWCIACMEATKEGADGSSEESPAMG